MPTLEDREERAVTALGEQIGFGRMMQLASQCWRKMLERSGVAGGEFVYGPCAAMVVPCECLDPGTPKGPAHCGWCCGTGRVTERVREAQRAARHIGELALKLLDRTAERDAHRTNEGPDLAAERFYRELHVLAVELGVPADVPSLECGERALAALRQLKASSATK